MSDPAAGLRHRPLVFVADLTRPELDPDDHHHLARALRVKPGTEVTLSDGRGRWRVARFDRHPDPIGDVVDGDGPAGAVLVAFTPVKGDRPEWVVQKLTELGVATIVVVEAQRSVVRWDQARAGRQLERFARVAREAAMQSRRLSLPVIEGVVPAGEVLARPGVAVAEPGGRPPRRTDQALAIGPEGGWTGEELAQAGDPVGLPGGVLRAETAAVAAATLLVAMGQGLVQEAPDRGGSTTSR